MSPLALRNNIQLNIGINCKIAVFSAICVLGIVNYMKGSVVLVLSEEELGIGWC